MSSSDESPDIGVKAGDVLAGKYRIDRVLGTGGMGAVVAAHHIQLEDKVALKFLLPEALARPEAVARFLREARAAVRIKSEHVARVSDVGQLENGAPYMVMEYLEGGDLDAFLARQGPLPPEQAVDFVLQAAEAIAEAHTLGIVHRDLKPANLFCIRAADGHLSIKVLDFGISKVTTPGSQHDMTRTTAMVGSPMYMSPEQMQSSRNVDARTDLWSLGAILFELITGRGAFLAESITELAVKVVNEPAPLLTDLAPHASPGLAQAVAKCLAKQRDDRYQTMSDLALALGPFGSKRARVSVERILDIQRAAGISQAVLPPSAAPPAMARTGQDTAASWDGARAPSKPRNSALFIGAIAGAVAVLGVAALLVLRHPAQPSTAATATATATAGAAPSPIVADETAAAQPSALPTLTPTPDTTLAPPPPPSAASSQATQPPPTRPARSAGPAPKPATKANCNPPYTVDPATGEHHYKPECL